MNFSSRSNTKREKLHSLQTLRFIAAFSVLFGHLMMEAHKFGLLGDEAYQLIDIFPWGSGVDLFFIISGFIIHYISKSIPPTITETKTFLLRRLIRVVPIYWFYTLLMVVAILCFGSILNDSSLSYNHVVASFMFIPWTNSSDIIRPILAQGWTLNYEMLFYVIATLALFWAPARRKKVILICLSLLHLTAIIIPSETVFDRFLSNSIILEFALGMWLCEYYLKHRSLKTPLSFALILLGLIWLTFVSYLFPDPTNYRFLTRGVPSGFIAAGVLMLPYLQREGGSCMRTISLLGDSSYSLYLSHPFILVTLGYMFGLLEITNLVFYTFTSILACLIASILSYILLEKPMMHASKRLLNVKNRKFVSLTVK